MAKTWHLYSKVSHLSEKINYETNVKNSESINKYFNHSNQSSFVVYFKFENSADIGKNSKAERAYFRIVFLR